jgi:hypothetical protein
MGWEGQVASMGDLRNMRKTFWWVHLNERDHSEDLGVDGKII